MNQKAKLGVSGAAAGLVNGLFGGGGGMVMAPLLTGWCGLEQKRALATCVGVILPFCVLSAAIYVLRGGFDWLADRRRHRRCAGRAAVPQGQRRGAAEALRPVPAVRRREVSAVTEWVLPLAVGTATGILSAWGVGGGTLLLLVMTLFLGVDQRTAQGINLLYFLPTAGAGLLFHRKAGMLDKQALRQAIPWGVATAALGAWCATAMDTELLRRPFGVYLLVMGVITLIKKPEP